MPPRRAVGAVELELEALHALAGREVVGVNGVGGAVAVLEDPERRAIGPHARGRVVTAPELVDVVLHRPLEVEFARRGAATAATAAATAAGGRDVRTATHRDRDLDGRQGTVLVDGFDRDGVGRLQGHNEGDPRGHGDLAAVRVDHERRRVGAGERIRQRVVLVDILGGDGRADEGAGLSVLGDGALGRRRLERGGVVHGEAAQRDRRHIGGEATGVPPSPGAPAPHSRRDLPRC